VFAEADGTVRVVETLTGHGTAVFALVFGLGVASFVGFTVWTEMARALRRSPDTFQLVATLILVASIIAELVLTVLIVRQTWGRTELAVGRGKTTLEFSGPLTRKWRRAWPNEQLGEIVLAPTQTAEDVTRLAELQLRPPGMMINLFTDHRQSTLAEILRRLNAARTGASPSPPVAPPVAAVPTWDTRARSPARDDRDQ
jgi:hypothetical protein